MNVLENAMEVAVYYGTEKTKIGFLNYDDKQQRFCVKTKRGKLANIAPDNYIHSGDAYILQDTEGKWKMCQCRKDTEDKWRMFGSDVTQDNVDNNRILYVPKNRLAMLSEVFLTEDVALTELSEVFINTLLNSN